MKILIKAVLLSIVLLLSVAGNTFAQHGTGNSESDPLIAMSGDPVQLAIDVHASLVFFGRTDDAYWISVCNHPSNGYSDGVWRLGWNRYFEDRATPGNTGSANPSDGNLPALHTAQHTTTPPPTDTTVSLTPVLDSIQRISDQLNGVNAQLSAKIDAVDAKIDAVDKKFTDFENNPPWLKKIFTNPTVLGVITAIITTWKVTAK